MIVEPNAIDYSKIKRVFVFGCSFTGYKWPTWADVLKTQAPNAEYYNVGRSGAGNTYIASNYSAYDKKYKFNEFDLILVMWSTFMREDKYIKKCWITPGNIFTQGIYPEEYVEKYSDTRGYLIRDLALIDLTTSAMENSKASCVNLMSVPADHQALEDNSDVLSLYSELINKFPKTLLEVMGGQWIFGHKYYDPHYDKSSKKKTVADNPDPNFEDYHPNTMDYYNYLNKLGFVLNNNAHKFAQDSYNTYLNRKHVDQFNYINEVNNYKSMEIL